MLLPSVQHAFNRAAYTYNAHCHLQQHVAHDLIQYLLLYQHVFHCGIDLGCGGGLITEMLLKQIQYDHFYAIDIAEKSLTLAHERLHAYYLKIEQQNFHEFDYDCLFDLMFSNLALHWSQDIAHTLTFLRKKLSTTGLLVLSVPLADTFKELVDVRKNHFYTHVEMCYLLNQAGYRMIFHSQKNYCYQYASQLEAMYTLKALGVNFVRRNHRGKIAWHLLRQLIAERNANQEKNFCLNYQIGFFIVTQP